MPRDPVELEERIAAEADEYEDDEPRWRQEDDPDFPGYDPHGTIPEEKPVITDDGSSPRGAVLRVSTYADDDAG